MVRKLRGQQLTIPESERDIVRLFHRHSIEEIMEMTGLRKSQIQIAVIEGIRRGEVAAYAPAKA